MLHQQQLEWYSLKLDQFLLTTSTRYVPVRAEKRTPQYIVTAEQTTGKGERARGKGERQHGSDDSENSNDSNSNG